MNLPKSSLNIIKEEVDVIGDALFGKDERRTNQALLPREILEPLYNKFIKQNPYGTSADFYLFLLKQNI